MLGGVALLINLSTTAVDAQEPAPQPAGMSGMPRTKRVTGYVELVTKS